MNKMCICCHLFFKSSSGFLLSKKKKKYIWNTKYTIQHSIKRSQTTKCIQYNINDTKSYELPKWFKRNGQGCSTADRSQQKNMNVGICLAQ